MTKQLNDAQRGLVEEHIWLVRLIAHDESLRFGFMAREEFVGIGYAALVEASLRFDPERGTFEGFARKHVRGRMIDAVRELQPEYRRRRFTREDVMAGKHVESFGLERDESSGGYVPVDLESIMDPATSMGTKYYNEQMWETAQSMIDELSQETRELAHAVFFEGLNKSEYARRKGIHHSTASARIDAGRTLLSERIASRERAARAKAQTQREDS